MDLRLIIKAMGGLSDTFDYDDCVECTQVFGKYLQRKIEDVVKGMPNGAHYSFTKYDSSTQTFKGIYTDDNIVLGVKIPVDCWYVDVSQIVSAHETEGYVFTTETIQCVQKQLKEVITDVLAPIAKVIKDLKEE